MTIHTLTTHFINQLRPRLRYEPQRYWNSRIDPNNDVGRSPVIVNRHVSYIRSHLNGPGPFLEYGPGVGRTIHAYPSGTHVHTLDISRIYGDALRQRAVDAGIALHERHAEDPTAPFPYADKQFATAVTSQVLLHVPPSSIRHVIRELLRVSECVVVISSYTHARATNYGSAYCFNHDYLTLFSEEGCCLDSLRSENGTLYFLARQAPC
ncbi:MAG: class I SAM-dependent methyltransferase [Planctomycetota bacterium]